MVTRLAPLNLSQNEIQNAVAQNLASAPASPRLGQFYFDTSTSPGTLYVWNGAAWVGAGGPAGGDLTGTYPNPTIAAGKVDTGKLADQAVTGAKIADAIKDPVAATAGLRTLGTGAQQAVSGTDARLSDKRVPVDGSVTDVQVAANAAIQLSKLATNPLARANHTGTQLAATISDFDQQVRTNRLDQLAKPTTILDFNGQRVQNLADPVNAQDAATKAYVDAGVQGLDVKGSVRAATTANITLSGLQTIDGVSLTAGQSVLVKNQTTASENGIYLVATGAWTRRGDFDTSGKVTPGAFTFVEEGLQNADSGYVLTTDGTVQLGTTALAFVQFSGAGQIDAGAGLTRTGNQLNVGGTLSRIAVSADSIDIDPTYVGQSSITTLGTVTTGTWNATTIALNKGGTGATDALGARTNIGATTKFAQTLVGGSTSEAVTHNLNTRDVSVDVFQVAAPYAQIEMDVELTALNSITLRASAAIPANTYRVVVVG